MSLSTYYLEYSRHLARLRHRRRAYASTSNTASHDNHEKIHSWVFFPFPYEYGAPLGGPSGHRSSAIILCSKYHIVHLPVRFAPLLFQSFALMILLSALELRMIICCMSRHVRFLLNEKRIRIYNLFLTLVSCHKFSRDSLKCNKWLKNDLTCPIPGKNQFQTTIPYNLRSDSKCIINRLRRTKRTEGFLTLRYF